MASPNPVAHLSSTFGNLRIELYVNEMPETAANFIDLVNKGFYDQMCWHDRKKGFIIGTGCAHTRQSQQNRALVGCGGAVPGTTYAVGNGTKERDANGCIPDEVPPREEKFSNKRGTVAMANCGPGTRSSQFFVNLGDNEFLDWWDDASPDSCPVFGRVVAGLDEIDPECPHATLRSAEMV